MTPMVQPSEIYSRWLAQLLSTEPADRPRAQAGVRDLYTAAGFEPPRYVFWFDSPFDACWANALLTAPHSSIWAQLLGGLAQMRFHREKIEQVRAQLCKSAAENNWDVLVAETGRPMGSHVPPPSLGSEVIGARMGLYGKVPPRRFDNGDALYLAESRHSFAGGDALHLAESRLWSPGRGVLNGQMNDRSVNSFLASSFLMEYSFSMMAADEQESARSTPPAILTAAWAIAGSSGPWWAYANAAVLTDRPAEMHLNERSLLHRGDGPAAVYRGGALVYAWNGKPLPARWILQQETLTTRELKEFDADFQEYVAARAGTAQRRTVTRKRASAALKLDLPCDPARRLEQLCRHNQGSLAFFDRYMAGEHEKVWKELVRLGPSVREDPHAADALAVAYETMRRVDANIRTVTVRLKEMKYEFKIAAQQVNRCARRVEGAMSFEAHVPPGPHVGQQLARLEKVAGALPLSLRVFYEVAGSVDWMGRHPALAPEQDSICPDPLVVFRLDDALEECKQRMKEEDETAVTIAPDDLHKANSSGGEPYEIAVPDLRADGELLNERHQLLFVEYLRLCFRFGGFPGFDGIGRSVPPEIDALREGLLAF